MADKLDPRTVSELELDFALSSISAMVNRKHVRVLMKACEEWLYRHPTAEQQRQRDGLRPKGEAQP